VSGPRIGELFAGYGGLGMGVQSVLGGELAWYAEFDKSPSAIMAHHWPDLTNYGDVTQVDWASVPKVDALTGGSPCQDLSHAGKRAGMGSGTRSGLWASMCDAIDIIRPRLVVWENVRGALSAKADSELEHCPGCVGSKRGKDLPPLRALGRVLGDLADLGYDARWYGLRASDVGAAHQRLRVFLFASPANTAGAGRAAFPGEREEPRRAGAAVAVDARGGAVGAGLNLLPTPAVNDMGENKTVEWWDEWAPRQKAADGRHAPHGKSLAIECKRLLPTPGASLSRSGPDYARTGRAGSGGDDLTTVVHKAQDWAQYEAAIRRQEATFGRLAPLPTEPGKNGPRLSAAFVEWLMGLPEGWVTDPAIGLPRNQQLRALGNGVVPQQAAAATAAWLGDVASEQAA